MRRWHSEVPLMYRRWRQELASHAYHNGYRRIYPYDSLAPASIACDVDCHCANGMGTMRKNRLDCGNARCGLCHYDKLYSPKNRANKKRDAIHFDLNAWGFED